jgi:hypothetical protein
MKSGKLDYGQNEDPPDRCILILARACLVASEDIDGLL